MDWEVLSEEFAEIEEPDEEQKQRQRKLISEFDEARAKMERESQEKNKKAKSWKDWFNPRQKNWWEVYDKASKSENADTSTTEEPREGASQQTNPDQSDGELQQEQAGTADAIFDLDALAHEVNDIAKIGASLEADEESSTQVACDQPKQTPDSQSDLHDK